MAAAPLLIDSTLSGHWAVGVSGGADSMALLHLVVDQTGVKPWVVHLDHELRGEDSRLDASFVEAAARKLGLGCTIARRSTLEEVAQVLPANPSSRYRKLRFALFRKVVEEQHLEGVLLAHHRQDDVETLLIRLLRGSSFLGLGGIRGDAVVDGVRVVRPLLHLTPGDLREYLSRRSIAWREDASNTSTKYRRNAVRAVLSNCPELLAAAEHMLDSLRKLGAVVQSWDASLPEAIPPGALSTMPEPVALRAARMWLVAHGADPQALRHGDVMRLLSMARDASTPRVQSFAGGLCVRRQKRLLVAFPNAAAL